MILVCRSERKVAINDFSVRILYFLFFNQPFYCCVTAVLQALFGEKKDLLKV